MAARRVKRKKLSPYTVAGVIVLCLVLCGTVTYKEIKLRKQSVTYEAQIQKLTDEQKELAKEKEELKEFKEYVKTDEYVEEIARDKLGLVYQDEIVFEPSDKK